MDTNLNNFGPKTYAAIMELLLRLRANTLWPAMHAGSRAFWFEKTNIPLITKYDIYMGSSHCEQMLRDNEYEWGRRATSSVAMATTTGFGIPTRK